MGRIGMFLVLFSLVHPAGFLDGTLAREPCPNVPVVVPTGGSVNRSILNTTNISRTSFKVQKYNTSTASWEDVIFSWVQGSYKSLSSFKDDLTFKDGYFVVQNVSLETDGHYRIVGTLNNQCVAIINLTVLDTRSLLPLVSGITTVTEEPRNVTKGEEPGSRIFLWLLAAGVGVLGTVLAILCTYGLMRVRKKASSHLEGLCNKLPHFLRYAANPQQPGSAPAPQESNELTSANVRDGDPAQGAGKRYRDSALEIDEEDLLLVDREPTREPRERGSLARDVRLTRGTGLRGKDPLAGNTGLAQGSGLGGKDSLAGDMGFALFDDH
ncbi:uncharacterized protein LOC142024920 [Carettochelys insculpta]|uniref:uncharacterized protein LOC142024920 n=1 Tax=Carettochelys insculpta TaxID=44489 RepID=UPI003EBFA603